MKLGELPPGHCEAAFRAWRCGSGPLLPYVRSTNFVSLGRHDGELPLPDPDAVPSLAGSVPETAPDELLVLDLPAAVCLRTGLDLARERGLWPIVTFSHWYHPRGVVGEAAAAALLLRRHPPETATAGWSLLLDYGRYSDAPLTAERFNNQYELTEDDVPTAAELTRMGLHGVCLVSTARPKEDLRRYAAHLAAAELTVRWHP